KELDGGPDAEKKGETHAIHFSCRLGICRGRGPGCQLRQPRRRIDWPDSTELQPGLSGKSHPLNAVVAHDPKKMPFSADVKYTENYQVLQMGDGFWKTAQSRGKYKHIFADPEAGQVASMETMIEADQPLLMSLRLRIELGRITEVESLYYRA